LLRYAILIGDIILLWFLYSILSIKILLFLENNSKKIKKPFSLIAKGLEMVKLPRQNDFRNFCMREETEKVYQELEKIIYINI